MQEIINTTIVDSTWTPVTLNATQSCRAFVFWSRNDETFLVRAVGTTKYATIRDGAKISIEELHGQGNTLFEAKSVDSASDTIEVIIAG